MFSLKWNGDRIHYQEAEDFFLNISCVCVCYQKQGVIGLPDTPVALHEINLEDLLPRYAPPVKPTGMLKLQLQFSEDRTTLNVIIIEVGRARSYSIPGRLQVC